MFAECGWTNYGSLKWHANETCGSATTEIVHDADVGAHSLSPEYNVSAVYNLHPLNVLLAFNALPSLYMHTPPLFQVKLEKDGWE